MPEPVTITCPYCGEAFRIDVDASAGSCSYIQDCEVCCRPITITLETDGDACAVRVAREDD